MSVLALARGSIILRCAGIALAVVFTLSSGFAHAQMPAQDAAAPAVEGPTLSSENLPPPTIETRPEPLPSPDIDFQPSWDSVNLALSEPDLALDPPSNPFWAGRRTGVSWLAAGGPAAFGITEFELGLSLAPIRRDSGAMLSVTPGFGFHAWSGARQLELPGQVFDTYLDINW